MDYLNEDSLFQGGERVRGAPVGDAESNRLRGLQTIAMSRLTYRVKKNYSNCLARHLGLAIPRTLPELRNNAGKVQRSLNRNVHHAAMIK